MSDEHGDEPLPFTAGSVVAGRYRLVGVLGKGSFGEVWEADDSVSGRPVAVKLLFSNVEIDLSRGQLEVHALRQGLPGVVELLDDGLEGAQAFVVMELVRGQPFPGRPVPCAWSEIAGVVMALLETLARVHAAFVIHRDLKPANVLVTSDGQVRLLDFGVAYRTGPIDGDTQDTLEILGTPAYMAPEQLRRRPITERTDLYSLGLMLYETLAGELPHAKAGNLLLARLNKPPPPLRELAPSVPVNIAQIVDSLIAMDPAARPASVLDVVARLRGESAVEGPSFLWLGSRDGFHEALDAARSGRSVDLVGGPGSGRTRWLDGLRGPLSQTRAAHWIEPDRRPGEGAAELRDLRPLAETLGLALTSAEALAAALGRALASGHALLVDDFERLDPGSRAVLEAVRAAGPVIRALDAPAPVAAGVAETAAVVAIPPLSEGDLRSLFAGPDRLLHLREDAARILFERTQGVPARVFREVSAWLHLGLARATRNLLVIPREALEQLDASVLFAASSAPDRLDRERRAIKPFGALDEADGRAAHAALAAEIEPGQRGRFSHLWLAGTSTDAARLELGREAIALATRLMHEGRIGSALTAIESGLRALRGMSPEAAGPRADLFALWAEAALAEGTPAAADRLLHALYKADPWPEREVIESLARTLKVESFSSPRALDLVHAIAPQSDPRLERLRLRTLIRAMRLCLDDSAEERFLEQLAAAGEALDPEIVALIDSALGRVRYRQGRFRDAAALHLAAARSSRPLDRISAKNAGAWALFEAFDLEAAAALVTEARALAEQSRHAGYEAEAAWTERSIAYRRGVAGGPDMELVRAVRHAVGRQVQGVILFTEAAAAFRTGHPDALALATRSHELLAAIDQPRGALLARCLAVALGAVAEAAEVEALTQKALSIQGVGIGLQALALLARGRHRAPPESQSKIATLAAEVPRESWATPMDILSVEESLAALGVSPPIE